MAEKLATEWFAEGAECYANGEYKKAVTYYERAASMGSADAQYILGSLYQLGERPVSQDYKVAAAFYQQAASKAHPQAQNNLGWLYQYGHGVSENQQKAIELYQQAAKQNIVEAQFNLGVIYANGLGVEKDNAMAMRFYQQAANQGYAQAQYILGWLHHFGDDSVVVDYKIAAVYYQQAADQGHPQAQNNLGWLYQNGYGVPQDESKAVELYHRAANKNIMEAQHNLGWMYQHGYSVAKDEVRAETFYQQAAEQVYVEDQHRMLEMMKKKEPLMKYLTYDWIKWIVENIESGCNKEELFSILLKNGFDEVLIQHALALTASSDILKENINYPKTPSNMSKTLFNLSEGRFKTAERVNTNKARIYIQRGFLTPKECEKIIKQIQLHLRPSTITNPNEPDKYFRTSKTCDLIHNDDPFIYSLDQKIADYMGIDMTCSERIQGQYYEVGNEFKLHTDYFEPNTSEYEKFANQQGQRTWTFMIYLNTVKAGGETAFPRVNFICQPQQGTAVIWNNADEMGRVNPDTAHWAKPIVEGEKYIITKWFRERP